MERKGFFESSKLMMNKEDVLKRARRQKKRSKEGGLERVKQWNQQVGKWSWKNVTMTNKEGVLQRITSWIYQQQGRGSRESKMMKSKKEGGSWETQWWLTTRRGFLKELDMNNSKEGIGQWKWLIEGGLLKEDNDEDE